MARLQSVVLPIVIIAGGGALAGTLVANGPRAESVEAEIPATFVEVEIAQPRRHHIRLDAMGIVKPEKSVVMQPEVAGRVTEQNTQLVPGGRVAKGDPLVRIDPRDYSAAVAAGQADLAQAKLLVQEERTLKTVAEHEWRERPEGFSEETLKFALRDPHLDAAQARVSSAKSRIEKAKRDLARTVVRAPFDAIVVDESVDVGQTVAPGVPVATLAGIEHFWVEVSIPVGQLRYLKIPGVNTEAAEGSRVTIFNEAAGSTAKPREGHIVKLLSSVDPRGRMAQVLVEVDDPLGVHVPIEERRLPLLLGTYVRVQIEGEALDDVVAVPRTALRDDGTLWVLDEEQRLHTQAVEIVHRERGQILTRGLEPGLRVVVTPMAIATEGMKVEVQAREPAPGHAEAAAEPRDPQPVSAPSEPPLVEATPSAMDPADVERTARASSTPRK